jgi:hypothetical protein
MTHRKDKKTKKARPLVLNQSSALRLHPATEGKGLKAGISEVLLQRLKLLHFTEI